MPVTVKQATKVKHKAVAEKKGVTAVPAVLVDSYAMAGAKVDQLEALLTQAKEQKAELHAQLINLPKVQAAPAEAKFLLEGVKFDAEISAKMNKRLCADNYTLKKEIGEELFMTLAKVQLGDLDKYVPPKTVSKVITEERSGPRRIKVIPKTL